MRASLRLGALPNQEIAPNMDMLQVFIYIAMKRAGEGDSSRVGKRRDLCYLSTNGTFYSSSSQLVVSNDECGGGELRMDAKRSRNYIGNGEG
jgi:hypothetical protein